jgi:hypothetical protein
MFWSLVKSQKHCAKEKEPKHDFAEKTLAIF